MLLRMSMKKIMVSSLSLFILLLIYLIPSSKMEELTLKNDDVTYIQNNTLETIYLLDKNDYIGRSSIVTCNCDVVSKAKQLIEGLIIDGMQSNIIPNGFRSILPPNTKILNLSLDNDVLTIDFSKDILDISKDYEEKMIEALVYTLTNLEGINKIKILVESNELKNLPNSGKKLNEILDKSFGINKEYSLTTLNNAQAYTVYYVSSYNDNYYYVPVTKYINNDNQDKIKLIINTLATSFSYESNLMSFLNESTKLLNYELNDDSITLNFNEMILNDIASGSILEEVVYTICLSLEDSLGVKEVVFNTNNQKISTILLKNLD